MDARLEQEEDGIWCAHAWLGSSGGANGNGGTPEEAVADLREAVQMVLDEDGIPALGSADRCSAAARTRSLDCDPPKSLNF
jgi:predicted RNase H-like HicB family nuclease